MSTFVADPAELFFDGDATHPLRYAATAFFTLPTAIVGFPSRKPPISCGDFHICGFFPYVPMISTSTQEELMRWAQHAMISTTIIFDHFWGAHSNVISLKYGELMANYSNLTGTDNCSIGLWQHVEAVHACVGNYNTLSMIHMYIIVYIYIIYIWRFPKIGVPPVIIHFNGFSNHKTRILRVAPFMETSILVYIYISYEISLHTIYSQNWISTPP